jgi:hypothetical protein
MTYPGKINKSFLWLFYSKWNINMRFPFPFTASRDRTN